MLKKITFITVFLLTALFTIGFFGFSYKTEAQIPRPQDLPLMRDIFRNARWMLLNCPRLASISNIEVTEGETAVITAAARDPNGDVLTYSITESYSNVDFTGSNPWTWLTEIGDAGTYLVSVGVTDGGCSPSRDVAITVNEYIEEPPEPQNILVVETSSSGVSYIVDTLEDEGHTVTLMSFSDVASGISGDYDAIVYPGGMDGVYAVFTVSGFADAIRNFVNNGGGFIGICGGSVAGAESLNYNGSYTISMLGLLDVTALDYSDWASYYIGSTVDLEFYIEENHEILGDLSSGETIEITYAGGPVFENIGSSITTLATFNENLDSSLEDYEVNGSPAIVVGEYGDGRVVLNSPHPEYDEDTRFLLLNAVEWVAEE